MVAAVVNYMPDRLDERDSILRILGEHPKLIGLIQRATKVSEDVFPSAPITITTGRFPDDEPLVVLVHVVDPTDDFTDRAIAFGGRVYADPDMDLDLIAFIPMPEASGTSDMLP